MYKLKQILENKILVPRRSKEERNKNLTIIHYKQIQEYNKNGSRGNLDFISSPIQKLPPNLIKVGGNLDLEDSKVESLGNLTEVEGFLDLSYCRNLTSLGNLKKVGRYLVLTNCPIEFLPDNLYIGNNLHLYGTNITEFPKNLKINGNLYIVGTDFMYRDKSQIMGMINEKGGSIKGNIIYV